MPFRVEHGSLEDIGKLSTTVSASKKAAKEAETAKEFSFRQALQAQAAQNEMRLLAYRQELDLEAAKMAQEWEVQKAALNSQENFKRFQYEKDLLHERALLKNIQDQEEMQNKVKALDRAKDDGWINDREYKTKLMEIISGFRAQKEDIASQMISSVMGKSSMLNTLTARQPEPAMTVEGVPYYQDETGRLIQGTAPSEVPQSGQLMTPELRALAMGQAYESKRRWLGLGGKKVVPNMPVVRAQLTMALDDPRLDSADKQKIMQALVSNDEEALVQIHKRWGGIE